MRCTVYGRAVVDLGAPEVRPVCNHLQAYFEVHKENDSSKGGDSMKFYACETLLE